MLSMSPPCVLLFMYLNKRENRNLMGFRAGLRHNSGACNGDKRVVYIDERVIVNVAGTS